MNTTNYEFKQLDGTSSGSIKELFVSVFSAEPWNDDWSDKTQLHAYIQDLTGQSNSLTFGLYEGTRLIGVSMGHIRHWYSGTEYYIDELCIRTETQGKGAGTLFIREIEKTCKEMGLKHIFLLTENNVPAFAFYKKRGYSELKTNAAFAKKL